MPNECGHVFSYKRYWRCSHFFDIFHQQFVNLFKNFNAKTHFLCKVFCRIQINAFVSHQAQISGLYIARFRLHNACVYNGGKGSRLANKLVIICEISRSACTSPPSRFVYDSLAHKTVILCLMHNILLLKFTQY